MSTRRCPHCDAPDYGSPFCVSCQKPFVREEPGAVAGFTEPVASPVAIEGIQLAGFFRRLGAFAVDWIALSILADIVRFAYTSGGAAEGEMMNLDAGMLLSAMLFLLYFTLFTGEGGQTLGKKVLGIKVVRTDGSPITYSRSLLRACGYGVSTFFFTFLGFLWAGWDRRKQGWHDKIAGTVVIRTMND